MIVTKQTTLFPASARKSDIIDALAATKAPDDAWVKDIDVEFYDEMNAFGEVYNVSTHATITLEWRVEE